MRSLLTGVSLAAVLLGGCNTTHTVYVDAGVPLGKACPNGDECYNGAVCAEGECTLPCTAPGDCQAGYACRPLAERQNELTCVKVTYAATTTVGKNCAIDDTVCGEGEYCYKRIAADPDAYCSRDCTDDRDCPATTYCQFVVADEGGTDDGCGRMEKKVCVKKNTFCAPCLFDSDCDLPGGGLCVADDHGGKFCTTTCIPHSTNPWDPNRSTCPQPHSDCVDRDGVNVCMHRYGSCVGDGSLCAPCRTRHDCAGTALCYGNTYSKEKFCTAVCGADSPCPTTQSFTCLTFTDSTLPAACASQCLNYSPGFDPADSNTYPTNPKYPTCWPDAAGVP
ncbi:MAG TPA: hypothetical protein VGQ83_01930 [Polyangia bacterium]|jgi:hypothetical protein